MIFLAYAGFILIMAAPFIVAALLIKGLIFGASLAFRGFANGDTAVAIAGVALTLACVAGFTAGWRWGVRGSAGQPVLTKIEPVTSVMAMRPRRFVLSLETGTQDVLDILADTFDRFESTRRYAPGSTALGDRPIEDYGRWLGEWQHVTIVDRAALRRGETVAATRLTPLDTPSPGPHFGINRKYDPQRPNYQLYHSDGSTVTQLYRCEIAMPLPPALALLPFGPVMFIGGPTYKESMARLQACRRAMLERLAADLG